MRLERSPPLPPLALKDVLQVPPHPGGPTIFTPSMTGTYGMATGPSPLTSYSPEVSNRTPKTPTAPVLLPAMPAPGAMPPSAPLTSRMQRTTVGPPPPVTRATRPSNATQTTAPPRPRWSYRTCQKCHLTWGAPTSRPPSLSSPPPVPRFTGPWNATRTTHLDAPINPVGHAPGATSPGPVSSLTPRTRMEMELRREIRCTKGEWGGFMEGGRACLSGHNMREQQSAPPAPAPPRRPSGQNGNGW
jgi:hypothetical protein